MGTGLLRCSIITECADFQTVGEPVLKPISARASAGCGDETPLRTRVFVIRGLGLRFIWKLICGNLEEQDSREESFLRRGIEEPVRMARD